MSTLYANVLQGRFDRLPDPNDTSIQTRTIWECTDRDLALYLVPAASGAGRVWRPFGGVETRKASVVAASTAALAAAYAVSADKDVLTASAPGALEAIGGVVLADGQRALLKNEAGGQNDGLFVVTDAGGVGHAWVLTRADDAVQGELVSGTIVFVEAGALAGDNWQLVTPDPIAVGVTAQTWVQTSGSGTYTAKAPALALVGSQFEVDGLALKPSATRTGASNPNVAATETFVPYDTTTGTFTITLPPCATVGSAFVLFAQDISGANGVNPAQFTTQGGDTIEGQGVLRYGVPYGGIAFKSDGVSKWTRLTRDVDPQYKSPVKAVFTTALPAYTVSADKLTLTANANGALPAADGVAPAVGDSVLLPVGAADADNGIYRVVQLGSGGSTWQLVRRSDADVTGRIVQQTRVAVQQGATYGGQVFAQTQPGPLTIGASAQVWRSTTSVTLYVDPAGGNDANPGTAASPLRTWNAGAWPVIAKLTNCNVTVTYVGATDDTSPTGKYVLPPGVVCTISVPWADIGTGAKTVDAGATTASIPVTGGGLAVNVAAGSRVRFTSGALAGQVYWITSNTAAALTPDILGLNAAPAQGDAFALERPALAFAPAIVAPTVIDASDGGCELVLLGFKWKSLNSALTLSGTVAVAGFELDQTGTFRGVTFEGSYTRVGFVHGTALIAGDALGSPQNLGAWAHDCNTTNAGPQLRGRCEVRNLVATQTTVIGNAGGNIVVNGLTLIGTTQAALLLHRGVVYEVRGLTQIGASTFVPLVIRNGSIGWLLSATFDPTLAADAITVSNASVEMQACTGVNATAGKVGVRVTDAGRVIATVAGNTVAGGAGALVVGAHATTVAWPAGGTLITDVLDANSQLCLFQS
jgi:hypothetical protein